MEAASHVIARHEAISWIQRTAGSLPAGRQAAPKKIYFMKNIFRILFVSFTLISCHQEIKPTDIAKINGYWEIEKVVFDQGKDKEYGINETYDYFKIDINNMGFRKKVTPQLDGTFLVNDVQEKVAIRFDKEKVFIDYTTPYAKWSEEVVAISDAELVLLNSDKNEYHYKKTGPINLLGDGKKVK